MVAGGSWVAWLQFPADANECPAAEQSPSPLAPVLGGARGVRADQRFGGVRTCAGLRGTTGM